MQTLDISQSKGVSVKQLTLLDSKNVHMAIFDSTGVTVQGVRMVAPANSPNTDGIHAQLSRHVSILNTTISTGDDCVSLGPGSSDVLIRDIKCGPGHGIRCHLQLPVHQPLLLCLLVISFDSIGFVLALDG